MTNNKQQTAVESLVEKLASLTFDYMAGFISKREYDQLSKGVIRQAKAMHKEEITQAWKKGDGQFDKVSDKMSLEYYEKTYGGNDE